MFLPIKTTSTYNSSSPKSPSSLPPPEYIIRRMGLAKFSTSLRFMRQSSASISRSIQSSVLSITSKRSFLSKWPWCPFCFMRQRESPTLDQDQEGGNPRGVVPAISYEFLRRIQYYNRQKQSRWKGKTQTPGWNVKFGSLLQASCKHSLSFYVEILEKTW